MVVALTKKFFDLSRPHLEKNMLAPYPAISHDDAQKRPDGDDVSTRTSACFLPQLRANNGLARRPGNREYFRWAGAYRGGHVKIRSTEKLKPTLAIKF